MFLFQRTRLDGCLVYSWSARKRIILHFTLSRLLENAIAITNTLEIQTSKITVYGKSVMTKFTSAKDFVELKRRLRMKLIR